jgi:hypothetical protein
MPGIHLLSLVISVASTPISGWSPSLAMSPCELPTPDLQRWTFESGTLRLATNSTASCVSYGGDGVPLKLQPCNSSNPVQRWTWDDAAGAVRQTGSSPAVCFNVRTEPGGGAEAGMVGGYFHVLRPPQASQ